ncbi:hypothetical protein L1281_000405 [Neisseria sp. HSC-16F19]|nr:hypothetical protein [Neisseria sp. HSC-16F19]MCP2039835.1 hypothetical protein [Neisseria sp. HSC-16F19]
MKKIMLLLGTAMLAACAHTAPATDARVQVYRSDGSRQCETEGATSPQLMQRVLENAGIRVYAARKDHLRGMAFPAVCGGATGSVNVFTIAADQAAWAQAQGFALWHDE